MLFAIINNSSSIGIENTEFQMFLMNCPYPIFDGIATNATISGFSVDYDITYGNGTDNQGSFFICFNANEGLELPIAESVSIVIKDYGATAFDFIPYGWLGYVADWFSSAFQKGGAFFTLVSYIVTPANFNVLGFTLEDLGGIGLLFVVFLYALCYISVGAWVYKTISPFGG